MTTPTAHLDAAPGDRGATFTVITSRPSLGMKLAVAAGVVLAAAIAIVVVVPALVIGLVVLLVAAAVAWVRGTIGRLTNPNGVLDGRRNVRVVAPGERR